MSEKLELRMYGFVPYNISEIQKGIQFGHAVVEYGQMVKKEKPDVEWLEANGHRYIHVNNLIEPSINEIYNDWANNWKTFIILNGGTSNHVDPEYIGSMEGILEELKKNEITLATFNEPDLNDMLSAVVFIIDERVFNRRVYLDFGDWVVENHFGYLKNNMLTNSKIERMRKEGYFLTGNSVEKKLYSDWVDSVGGEKNVFLRDFLNPNKVKLA
jgi:hypothetical protein